MKAVALEEGAGDDEDLEADLPPRPVGRIHSVKVSLAIILVIVSQILGISKVRHVTHSHHLINYQKLTRRQILNQYMWDGGYYRFLLVRLRTSSLFELASSALILDK